MTETLTLTKLNEVYLHIKCSQGVAYELADYFSFRVPNAHFIPSVRDKIWDGYIRLFDRRDNSLYYGLLPYVEKFSKDRSYNIIRAESITGQSPYSLAEAAEFIEEMIQTGLPLKPRKYQVKNYADAIRNERALFVSPTASGKSLVIFLIAAYYDLKTLIIVPTTSLVSQMYTDFADYAGKEWAEENIHRVTAGRDKGSEKQVVISTWQSIYKLGRGYFEQYQLVIGDEAHLFQAKSLKAIMTKLTDCKYRFGFTGTLDGMETNKLVLEGLFGTVNHIVSTKKLAV
jgi:superfamily II DNA or RNA helicase